MVVGDPGRHGEIVLLHAQMEPKQELDSAMTPNLCLEVPIVPQTRQEPKCGVL